MQFSFTGISKITMDHMPGQNTSKHVATDFRLEAEGVPNGIYLNEEELPTKEGVKPLTLALVHGLIGNIHMAHENGYWDSAEHFRYIMAELERGFVTVAHTHKSKM